MDDLLDSVAERGVGVVADQPCYIDQLLIVFLQQRCRLLQAVRYSSGVSCWIKCKTSTAITREPGDVASMRPFYSAALVSVTP